MIEYYDEAFKLIRYTLWITGLRPFKNHVKPLVFGSLMYQALVISLTTTSFHYDKTFLDIVDIIVTEFMIIHVVLRLVTLIYFQDELKRMHRDLEQLRPISDPKLHVIFKYLKNFQLFVMTEGVLIIGAISMHGFITGQRPLHFYRPEAIPKALFTILIMDGYYFFLGFMVVGFDLFFLTVTIILTVQYKILNGNLQNCSMDNEQQQKFLEICVKHHNLLKGINIIFGPMLLVYMWIMVVLIGMLMYTIYERNGNPLDFSKYFTMIFSLIVEMFICYVVPSQLLTNEIDQLFDELYCTNWYEYSVPVQKTLAIILTKKETDAVITAAGKLVDMNFKACTSMFRTCFSVFTFLVHMRNFGSMDDKL